MSSMNDAIETRLGRYVMRRAGLHELFIKFPESYVVGGFVRDFLLSSKCSGDIDLAIPAKDFQHALKWAKGHFNATAVGLHEDVCRFVTKDKRAIIDLAQFDESIEEDLLRRDFTMNAIAWSPSRGLIDVTGGVEDIRRRRIRHVSRENLIDDPLRVLRAFRFNQELRLPISKRTDKVLQELAGLIVEAKAERVTYELFRFFNAVDDVKCLKENALQEQLFAILHDNSVYYKVKLKLISRVLDNLHELPKNITGSEISQGVNLRGMTILSVLMIGVDIDAAHLSFSNIVRRRVRAVSDAMRTMKPLEGLELYRAMVLAAQGGGIELLLMSNCSNIKGGYDGFIEVMDKPLLEAEYLMTELGVSQGPEVGRIMAEIRVRQLMGEIRTRQQAVGLASEMLS